MLGDGVYMNIYDLLNECIVIKKYGLNAGVFKDEDRERLDTEEEKLVFDLLKNVSSMAIKVNKKGATFHPFMVWEGKRTFSIEDLTEDDYKILEVLDLEKLPANVRARVADVLWTQKKNYKAAIVAAKAYYELFCLLFTDEDWVGTLDMIKRTLFISAQTNQKDIYNEAGDKLFNHVVKVNGQDKDFQSLRLLDILVEQGYGDFKVLLTVVENIINNNINDVTKVEQAYRLKVECLYKTKNKVAAIKSNIELADYYVNYAEGILGVNLQGALQAERFYQKAIELYRNNGEAAKGEEVLRRLVEIQKEIPKQMLPIKMEFDVSGVNANIDENMAGLTFEESIIRLTQMVSFPKKDDIKAKFYKECSDSPISHIFGKNLVNASGQTVLALKPLNFNDPEADLELLDLYLHQKVLEEQRISGDVWLKYSFYYIRKNYEFELSDLNFLVCDNPIIPMGRENIFRSAIYMVLKGQYYEAMHILAPQVENLFRNIAKEVGGLTITLDNDGASKEKVLKSIFDLPELLDCYDNDILFLFKGLLNEQAGANIRNEIAHGITSEYMASSGAYLYFAGAVIKLLTYTSIKCYELITTEGSKLKTFIEPESDAIKIKRM